MNIRKRLHEVCYSQMSLSEVVLT